MKVFILQVKYFVIFSREEMSEITELFCRFADIDSLKVIKRVAQDIREHKLLLLSELSSKKEFITNLELLVTLVKNLTESDAKKDTFKNELSEISLRLCLPILQQLHPSTNDKEDVRQILLITCDLLVECMHRTSIYESLKLFDKFIAALKVCKEEQECGIVYGLSHCPEGYIDLLSIVEFTRAYLNVHKYQRLDSEISNLFDEIFSQMICTIHLATEKVFTRVISGAFFYLLKIENDKTDRRLGILWQHISLLCKSNKLKKNTFDERALMIFCSLADFFFPVSSHLPATDLVCCDDFWTVVQSGLCAENPLSRKRSLYLLKRVVDTCEKRGVDVNKGSSETPVFQWCADTQKDVCKVWETYLLLVETLEEKQVHVIKPLLWRMQTLIRAACSGEGKWNLHTSWLATVLCRCFQHESHHVVSWAVDTVLGLDFTMVPFLEQGQSQFLSGRFLYILQELRLFLRPSTVELSACPPVGEELVIFFTNCMHALKTSDKQNEFLTCVLTTLLSATWGSIPLFFMCRALAKIPSAPVIQPNTLVHIKEMMVKLMTTLEILPKGAIQCHLLQTVIHLTDMSATSVEDIAAILAMFDRGESLRRGTLLWTEVVEWIQQTVADQWSTGRLHSTLRQMVFDFLADDSETVCSSMRLTKISRLVVVSIDAGLLSTASDYSQILGQVTTVINSINSHVYMAKVKADRAVAILATIATEHLSISVSDTASDKPPDLVEQMVAECWHEVMVYVGRRVTQDIQEMCDLGLVDIFTDCLKMLCTNYLTPAECSDALYALAALCSKTLFANKHKPMKYLQEQLNLVSCYSVLAAIAAIVDNNEHTDMAPIRNTLLEIARCMDLTSTFTKLPSRGNMGAVQSQKDWGRVVSRYICCQWKCLQFLLERLPDLLPASQLLDACYKAFDVGTRDSDVAVLQCAKSIITQMNKVSEDQVCDMIRIAWVKANEELHTATYWRKLECFVCLICQMPLLQSKPGTAINMCLIEHMGLLFRLGEEKMGLVNLLLEHLFPILVSDKSVQVATNILPVLVDACVFGGIHKRTDRLVLELSAFIESQGKDCAANEVVNRTSKNDGTVRVFVVNFLCKLDTRCRIHVEFGLALLLQLYDRYNCLVDAADYRQYNNSLCHRQKNRIFQTICVLEPFVKPEFGQDELWRFVWRCLVLEAHPSVRHMQEWLIMRQVYRFPELLNRVWDQFAQFNDKRNLSLCSLMHILARVGPHLHSLLQGDFYSQALTRLLPWCLAHHFNTRVHAQASLGLLWRQCQQLGLNDQLTKNMILQTIVDFQSDNNNSTKNLQKLVTNYFYQTFDFLQDYSIETIFLTLPKLAKLTHEEWLPPAVFSRLDSSWSCHPEGKVLPLFNLSSALSKCTPGPWKIKPPADTEVAEDEFMDGDVQKKIMPWRLMTPEEDSNNELRASSKKIHKAGGLILVTSLIDKVPNLGGLCRTSEIFGVSEFIIGNLCFVEDKAFQNLSVTAQNWIPITEVPPHRLPEFLEAKRRNGYTLVGVEQTANSVSLTHYKFPTKTLLLLGNEKEGLPVNLIQLLDVCVEIPQQGIIRSLNVHVSGALFIWEYARQQLEIHAS